jgi:hypothetical protein
LSELSVEFQDTKWVFSTSRLTAGGGTAVNAGVKLSLVNSDGDSAGLGLGDDEDERPLE